MKYLFILASLFAFQLANAQNNLPDLNGEWTISIDQQSDDNPVAYEMIVNIKQTGARVIGEFNFVLKDIPLPFDKELKGVKGFKTPFSGQIYKGHIRMDYENVNPGIDQFGSAMIKIISDKKMEGHFLGFGPETQEIVVGTLTFSR